MLVINLQSVVIVYSSDYRINVAHLPQVLNRCSKKSDPLATATASKNKIVFFQMERVFFQNYCKLNELEIIIMDLCESGKISVGNIK